MQRTNIVGSVILAAGLTACGGGGGGAAASAPAPVQASPAPAVASAGIYDVDYRQFSGVYTFLDNGEFYGLHFVSGEVLAGHPRGKLEAGNSTTNPGKISWANFIDDARMVGQQEANGMFGRTFSANGLAVAISGSMGSFNASAAAQKKHSANSAKTLYGDPLALAEMAGTWSGSVRTVGIGETRQKLEGVTIDVSGNFRAVDGACEVKAKLAQHGATGIYTVQATVAGADCKLRPAMHGIVTPLSIDNNRIKIAVQLNSDDQAQTAVFILDK